MMREGLAGHFLYLLLKAVQEFFQKKIYAISILFTMSCGLNRVPPKDMLKS